MSIYHSGGDVDPNKPKMTVSKVLYKFVTLWGLQVTEHTKVYYAWKKRQPKWRINKVTGQYEPKNPYFTVDYDSSKREWFLGYIVSANNRKYCTVDDLTGECSLSGQ